jgi:hypothetical protein
MMGTASALLPFCLQSLSWSPPPFLSTPRMPLCLPGDRGKASRHFALDFGSRRSSFSCAATRCSKSPAPLYSTLI